MNRSLKLITVARNYPSEGDTQNGAFVHVLMRDGLQVHGEFFTHLLEQLEWPAKFRVAQFQGLQAEVRSINWKVASGLPPGEPDVADMARYISGTSGPPEQSACYSEIHRRDSCHGDPQEKILHFCG